MSFRPKYVLFAGICKVLKVVFWIAALISPLSMRIRIKRSKELLKRTLDTTLVIVDMQPSFAASALVLPVALPSAGQGQHSPPVSFLDPSKMG